MNGKREGNDPEMSGTWREMSGKWAEQHRRSLGISRYLKVSQGISR
jgi:hypothetical protein